MANGKTKQPDAEQPRRQEPRHIRVRAREIAERYPAALSRDTLRQLLLDREWHCITTLAQIVIDQVPVEVTSQFYVSAGGSEKIKRERASTPVDKQAEAGMLLILRQLLDDLVFDHMVDRQYTDLYTEYRLTGSRCVACGRPARESPGDDKCKQCFAKGWFCKNCGTHVTGSMAEKQCLCEDCAKLMGVT